jgi:hypothetical protein
LCNCKKPTPISVFSPQPLPEPTPIPVVEDWYNNIDTIEPIEDNE